MADDRQSPDRQVALTGLIRGLVQGVFFRAETRRQASRLGVKGWVRNTPDGHVEVFLCGHATAVAAMHDWLQTGPTLARVESVELKPAAIDAALTSFEIRH